MIHLILVRFNSQVTQELHTTTLQKFDSVNVVWTSDTHGRILENPNDCFEFSGYQEGLGRFLNSDINSLVARGSDHHSIIFANDTIFTGHLSCMRDFMIESLMQLGSKPTDLCAVTGLVMPISDELKMLTGSQSYFSSWLFMIEGTLKQLEKVQFYPKGLKVDSFVSEIEPNLPLPYLKSIERWLNPRSALKGWYKASVGKKISIETFRRKRFSIYLELSLSQYLQSQGLKRFCISERIGFYSQVELKILRLLDRIYVNFLKLSSRFFTRCNLK